MPIDAELGPGLQSVVIGAIVPDAKMLGSELLVSKSWAEETGLDRPDRVLLWNLRNADDAARRATGIVGDRFVDRSWAVDRLDGVLSQAALKTLAGEFAIAREPEGITIEPGWLDANVRRTDLPIIGPVSCHRLLIAPLRAALREIDGAGLAPLIDVDDTSRYGGCLSVREIRSVSGSQGRNLSRHSWAVAIDINPSTNPYGGIATIDPRIVDVFRRNGFAWGGSFPITDGMHFEFIGSPRVEGPPLPSAPPTTTSTTSTTTTSPTTTTSTTTSTTTPPTTSTTAATATLPRTTATTTTTAPTATTATTTTTVTANATTAPSAGATTPPGTTPTTPTSVASTSTTAVAGLPG